MKKLLVLLVLLLLVFTWCSCTDAEEPPIGGDLPSRDEVPPSDAPDAPELTVRTDVTMENVRYEEDHILYTLVNHTDRPQTVMMYPYVQKAVEGKWQYVCHTDEGKYTLQVPANGSCDWSVRTQIAYTQVGEFRLILGDYASIEVIDGNENDALSFKTGKTYIIGALTISEIDPPDIGTVTVRDGLPQNDLFYIEDARYMDGKIFYTVVNNSDFRVNYAEKPYVQKLINGQWESFELYTEMEEAWGSGANSHSTDARSFEVQGVSEEDLPGEYRLLYSSADSVFHKNMWANVVEEPFYIVGYLTIE